MSEEVVGYQVLIIITIALTGIVVGPRAMMTVAIGWVIWTFSMVFTRWLYLLQFATVAASVMAGLGVQTHARYLGVRRVFRRALALLVVAGAALAAYVAFDNHQRPPTPVFSAPAVTLPAFPDSPQSVAPPLSLAQQRKADEEDERVSLVVARLRRDNLVLNPDSPHFYQPYVDRIVERQRTHILRGLTPSIALDMAAGEIMAERELPKQLYRCKGNAFQDFPCSGK